MVIDASIGVKLIVPEGDSAKAIEAITQGDIAVPTLFHVEVGNAVWKKVCRDEIELAPILTYLSGLQELAQTVNETPLMARAVEIAIMLGHPVYDCVYLALAEAQDDQVLTADKRFLTVVGATEFAGRVVAL